MQPTGKSVHLDRRITAAFTSPDNRTAVALTANPDDSIVTHSPSRGWALVDLVAGRVLRTGRLDIEDAISADFSPDGERIAISGVSGDLWLMDASSGKPVRRPTIRNEDAGVGSVKFADDGDLVLTTGASTEVNLWDGHTGELLGTVTAGTFSSAHFLPDGRSVLIADYDGDVYTWDISVDHWLDFACEVVGRSLNSTEWEDAFGDRAYRKTCPDA